MFSPLNEKEKLRISNLSHNPFFSLTLHERTHWSSVGGGGSLTVSVKVINMHSTWSCNLTSIIYLFLKKYTHSSWQRCLCKDYHYIYKLKCISGKKFRFQKFLDFITLSKGLQSWIYKHLSLARINCEEEKSKFQNSVYGMIPSLWK